MQKKRLVTDESLSMNKTQVAFFLLDILLTIVGTFIFAASVHFFTAPNLIAPGGVVGISTIISTVTDIKIGTINICLNIPIVILGFFFLGKRFMIKTIVSTLSFTLIIDYLLPIFPVFTGDKLVASIFGGVLMGAGIGVVLSRGSSTGGMDIINKLIAKRLPHLKFGRIVFATDFIIVSASAIVFKSIEPALYALISLYISSVALDSVLYGFNICKCMYIISDKADEIAKHITTELGRGATILEAYGAYTKERRPTIMVAVRQNEYYKVKKIIKNSDPGAFIIISPANEILGLGFSKNDA